MGIQALVGVGDGKGELARDGLRRTGGQSFDKVLLVEDNPGDARLLREMFNEQDPRRTALTHVPRMSDAEKHLAEESVDIVLLDLGLPDAQGMNAVRRIRAAAPRVPLVVLTGRDDESLAAQALQEGAQDYLVKGQIETRGLLRALRYAIERNNLEERYRNLVEQANDAILLFRPDLRILEANRRAENLLGCPRDHILERSYESFVDPEDQGLLAAEWARLLAEGATQVQDRRLRRTDDSVVFVDISASLVRTGDETFVLAILHDTSERKGAERERALLEAQLLQSQKMEAVGRLAGGIAHDFNNLLGVIMGYGELLLRDLGFKHPGSKRLEQILRAAERAAGLTRQLLAFSRKQVLQPRILDLNGIVREVDAMLRRVIGEDIRLVTRPGPALGRICADPGQIEQVLLNLVVNARDAMPQGGGLTLETANVALDEAFTAANPEVQPGPFVMMSVTDTGTGMDAETRAHIFEPFFTTKEQGKGTGLGLATVFGIVQQCGGCISVETRPRVGTTFKLYFPRVEEPLSMPSEPRLGPSPRGAEGVLLVEDADSLRVMVREILEGAGYTVVECLDPEDALLKVSAAAAPARLLLTDVVMPRMNGPDLARRVRIAWPEVKVLYMSGYTDEATGLHGVLAAGTHFIQKPFSADAILRKVREALDEPPGAWNAGRP